jgi:hypothetical protein
VHCQMRWGDRQGVGGESPHDEGVANCIEPEPCGFVRQGRSEASVAAHSSAIEPRKAFVLDADAVDRAEADAGGASSRELVWSGVVEEPGMCVSSLYLESLAGRLRRPAGPCREGEEP